MKNIVFAILMMPGICFLAKSQDTMRSLDIMVGSWSGSGWYRDRAGERFNFTQNEEITQELGNTTLLIKGKGFIEDKIIHDAMAIIQYDSVGAKFDFHSFLANGQKTKATFEVKSEGTFEWWFAIESGTIKYWINIKEDTWNEKGAFSPDGSNWYPFIEFNLIKE